MTTKINTYEDLLMEKERLKLQLQIQKQLIRQDINEIKEEFKPIRTAFSTINKLTSRDTGNWVLNATANKAIDLVFKKVILARAGWLTRFIVPFFLKNYSSHVIADHKNDIISTIFSWFKKKGSSNGHPKHAEEEYDSPPSVLSNSKTLFLPPLIGDVAQLARALAWHARGQGFESPYLHNI